MDLLREVDGAIIAALVPAGDTPDEVNRELRAKHEKLRRIIHWWKSR